MADRPSDGRLLVCAIQRGGRFSPQIRHLFSCVQLLHLIPHRQRDWYLINPTSTFLDEAEVSCSRTEHIQLACGTASTVQPNSAAA
jgi:hypothetical protein